MPLPRPSLLRSLPPLSRTSALIPTRTAQRTPIRTFFRQPERDPSVPPTYEELEQEARIGRLRVIVVSLPLVVVCGYILYKRLMLGEEQRRLALEGLGGEPPKGKIGGNLATGEPYTPPPRRPVGGNEKVV